MSHKTRVAVLFVSVLVATSVVAVGALAAAGPTPAAADGSAVYQTGNQTNATTANETANVTFENQTSNGSAVVVNETYVPEGGFIAIHLVENETFGAVIGNSSYLEPGLHENVTVALDPPITESQPLIAMPHTDSNGNQTYDFPAGDEPYTVNGTPVTDQANVTVTNETMGNVSMTNETTMGNETNASSGNDSSGGGYAIGA